MTSLVRLCAKSIYASCMLIIVTSSLTFAGETGPDDPRQIKGDVWGRKSHDTLIVRFDIRTDHFIADSIFILKSGNSWDTAAVWRLIYLSSRTSNELDSLKHEVKLASRISVRGVDTFLVRSGGTFLDCCFRASGRDERGQAFQTTICPDILSSRGSATLGLNYGYGRYEAKGTGRVTQCFVSGLTVGGAHNSPRRNIAVELFGSFGGSSKNYYSKWGAVGKFTYFTGDRTNFLPAPFSGIEFNRLSAKSDGSWIRRSSNLGGVIGVGFHGRFERLTYTYHTTQHGFHEVELFLAVASSDESRGGTVFRVEANRNLLTIGLALRVEGLDADGVAMGFHRFENRPWWHRGLAYASIVPFLPLKLVDKFFRKDEQ